jgi:hypothetical protein
LKRIGRWIIRKLISWFHLQRPQKSQLLRIAQRSFDRLHLWTFQRNMHARRFYGVRGFLLVEETDGARNDEKEPDALYLSMPAKKGQAPPDLRYFSPARK